MNHASKLAAVAGLTALLSSQLSAQTCHIDSPSSIAGGTGQVRLKGEPSAPYMIWWSTDETPTVVDGFLLAVDPFRSILYGAHIEGFLDGNGLAVHEFPTTPEWDLGRISLQAVTLRNGAMDVSNLTRSTFQVTDSVRASVGIPAALSILGDLFPLADGSLLAIGGAGPVVETYTPWDQETLPSGLANPSYLFSARAQLADGRILVVGGLEVGLDGGGMPTLAAKDEAYIYDPSTGTYDATPGPMTTPRAGATATLLGNGKVLVFGGLGAIDLADPLSLLTGILASTELFDPATGLFTAGPTLIEGKAFHTATRLGNGQVLVAGGLGTAFGVPFVANTAYLYNPNNNSFGLFPKLFTGGRMLHTATLLGNGKVVIAGGITADLSGVIRSGNLSQIIFGTVATTAIFDPSGILGGSFANGPTMNEPRALHTATRLPGDRLLAAGGVSGDLDLGGILSGNLGNLVLPSPLDHTEILGFAPLQVSAGPNLSAARAGASAIVSPMDSRVVIFGGGPLQAELYQP